MKSNKRNRRSFLISSGTVSLGFLGLSHFINNPIKAGELETAKVGYGPLVPDPQNLIELPKGFSYRIISTQGDKMSDGLLVPGKPDGMATFYQDKNRTLVIRNHENSHEDPGSSPFGADLKLLSKVDKNKIYDFGNGKQPGTGGTTTFIYNHRTNRVEREFLSLAGTIVNCAGGPTPWNSWISCEETDAKAGGSLEKDHGYNFEVPASSKIGLADPIPLKAMGRFRHEAVAVDPRSGIVYQTEDMHDGMIYRFIPQVPGKLHEGGKLQALAIKEIPSCDTRNW
ncbi:MAG: alkaline phosphatase PhoX, partial [Aurantibacter sp.]